MASSSKSSSSSSSKSKVDVGKFRREAEQGISVPGSTPPKKTPTQEFRDIAEGKKSPLPVSRGGGSSSSGGGNTYQSSNRSPTPPGYTLSPQTISNAEQIQAKTLAYQNEKARADAIQADKNYTIITKEVKPTSTYYSSNPNFVGREEGSITIYTDKRGVTTGGASFGGSIISGLPSGLNVGRNATTSSGQTVLASDFLAKNISLTSTQQFLAPKSSSVLDTGSQQSSLVTDKSFIQSVRDITGRQNSLIQSQKLTKDEIFANPIKAGVKAISIGFQELGMGIKNIETTSSAVFGYGSLTTPSFVDKNQVISNTKSSPLNFIIPGYSLSKNIKETFRQRDIGEQGTVLQKDFASSITNSTTTDQFNFGANNLQASGLGSTNSSGAFNFKVPTTTIANIYADPNSTNTQKYSATTSVLLGKTTEAFTTGYALESLGIVGAISRGSQYISQGSKIGKGFVIGTGTALTVAPVAITSFTTSKDFTAAGASGKAGALIGAGEGLSQISGFLTGATKGEFLFAPGLKLRDVGIPDQLGKAPTKALSFENPFGKGSYPLITSSPEEITFFGYPKNLNAKTFGLSSEIKAGDYGYQASSKTEVGFIQKAISSDPILKGGRLATEQIIFEEGLGIIRGLSGVKIKEVNIIPFEKSGVFENLGTNVKAKDTIKNYFTELGTEQKGFKGFINAVRNTGLERVYGSSTISAEGGFKTNVVRKNSEFGDFDLNFRDNAIPKAQKLFNQLKESGADVRLQNSLIELKNPKTGQYEHAFDFHGADTPDLQMKSIKLGIKGVGTKQFGLDSGTIGGQQLRQSLVDKGSATLQLRVNKQGQLFFSPPDYRVKDVTDFISISESLNVAKGGNKFGGKIESLKNVLQVAYPSIKFGGDSKLLYGGLPSVKADNSLTLSSLSSFKSNGLTSVSRQSGFESRSNFKSSNSLGSLSSPSISIKSNSFSPSAFSSKGLRSSFSRSSSPSTYSSLSPSFSPSRSFSPSPSKSPSPSPYPYSPSPSKSPSPYPSPSPDSYFSTYNPIPNLGLGGYAQPKGFSSGRKSGFSIAPSFSSTVLNIQSKSPIKVSGSLGVLPNQIRPLFVGKRSKKEKYFKLTNL